MFKHQVSLYDYFTGDYETTPEKITQALERACNTGVHVSTYQLNCIKASLALCDGDIPDAARTLKELSAGEISARPFDRGYYHFLRAWEAVLQGRPADAVAHAALALEQVVTRSGMVLCEPFATLLFAEVLHENGEVKKAAKYLSMAGDLACRMKSNFMKFSCLLAESHMMLDLHRDDKALEALHGAMTLGNRQKYMGVLFWRPDVMSRLCAKALEAGIEVEYVRKLIIKRKLVPDAQSVHLANWPWPLKIYTLGNFIIEKDGKPLDLQGASRKSLDILKIIIALGGQGIREERITEVLWPDAEGDAAHSAFTTTLSRLRKFIGEDALAMKGGKVSLNAMHCWVDVMALDYLMTLMEEKHAKDQVAAAYLSGKCFSIYRGPFLASDTDEPHYYPIRERLRLRFMGCVSTCGEGLMREKRYEEAIPLYKKGLEVDELSEEFYRGLMSCYLGLGRYAEGLAVYRRCNDLLLRTFDVGPSGETEDLRRALKQRR